MTLTPYLLVFTGGGLGAIVRFGISRWIVSQHQELLWGTLLANFLACILLGYLAFSPESSSLSTNGRLLIATGFCGGLSTFSTFSLEAFNLFLEGRSLHAVLYVMGSFFIGLVGLGASFYLLR